MKDLKEKLNLREILKDELAHLHDVLSLRAEVVNFKFNKNIAFSTITSDECHVDSITFSAISSLKSLAPSITIYRDCFELDSDDFTEDELEDKISAFVYEEYEERMTGDIEYYSFPVEKIIAAIDILTMNFPKGERDA